MLPWLDKLTDLAALQGDESVVKEALAQVTRQAGFDRYAYLHIQHGHTIAVSDYDAAWRALYFKRKYNTLDPVVRRAKSVKQAFSWSAEQERPRLSQPERAFFSLATDFGIRSGITIPIRTANGSISMFTMASDALHIGSNHEIDAVAAASAVGQLHMRISLLQEASSGEDPAWLHPREATYLKWIAVGKSMEDVAAMEGVTYNSVRVKIAELKKRFNVHTMTHLVSLAIRKKLI